MPTVAIKGREAFDVGSGRMSVLATEIAGYAAGDRGRRRPTKW